MAPSAKLKGAIRLQAGAKVQVTGLKNRAELNGIVGQCLQFDTAKMRWGVELPDGQKISLKMGNILPVDAEVLPADLSGPDGTPAVAEGPPLTEAVASVSTPFAEVAPQAADAATSEALQQPVPAEPGTEAEPPGAEPSASDPESTAAGAARAAAAAAGLAEEPRAAAAAETAEATGAAKAAEAAEAAAPAPVTEAAEGSMPAGAPQGPEAEAAAEADEEADSADMFELPCKPVDPAARRIGRWFENEHASEKFAEQLRLDDPKLKSVCLVPPKRFDEQDVETICSALEVNTQCHELLASGHSLRESACRRIAQMLRTNNTLQLLSLGESSLGDRACLLFEGLAANRSLTSLDLEHKGLTVEAGRHLAKALAARKELGAPGLETLRLSRNGAFVGALAELARGPAPRELLLCDCALGEPEAEAVGRWVARGIEDLDLRDNSRLGSDGLELLLQAAWPSGSVAPPLRRLRLDGCAVGDDGLEALGAALARGLELEDLFLERCEITPTGCRFLEHGLRGRRLNMLSVRTNVLGDEGVELLGACSARLDVGATNTSARAFAALGEQPLISVELFNNPLLGPSSAAWITELSSEHWQQLEQLEMTGCTLGNDGFRRFCSKLLQQPAIMPRLTNLVLGGNDVEDSDEFNDLADHLAEGRGGLRVVWKST